MKKEKIIEELTSRMNQQFETVKTLKKIYYFFYLILISYLLIQGYIFENIYNSFGFLGFIPLLILVIFIFANYTKLKDIALSNSNIGYYLFKLKFGEEYDIWLKHNEDAGNKLLSNVIGKYKNRKDLVKDFGNSKIRYLCFRNKEGYHEDVSQYTDIIAIVNSTYTDSGYKIYETSIEYFWHEKKIMDRRKNSKFPF